MSGPSKDLICDFCDSHILPWAIFDVLYTVSSKLVNIKCCHCIKKDNPNIWKCPNTYEEFINKI